MCGIAGFLTYSTPASKGSKDRASPDASKVRLAEAMISTIRHRGPDASSVWQSENGAATLAHARLSIIDLQTTGNQPMHGASGRYSVVYNGEIYNFKQIREELVSLGVSDWRGTSDTEVLLAAVQQFGLEKTLERLVGMFAIALWDSELQRLSLVRDRFGEKPLYVSNSSSELVFASELPALLKHPSIQATISPHSVQQYLQNGCVPAPFSIYERVFKLDPGSVLHIGKDGSTESARYWSVSAMAERGIENTFAGSENDAVDTLHSLLGRSVSGQMISDVSLGAFLSGGIDSSLITALMQEQSSVPVNTFSIGFSHADFDEAPYAADVAKTLGTHHSELYVSDADVVNLVPKMSEIYSEPFADSSQIPTVFVSALAKKSVTVALSGDAGDELFCGYNRYLFAASQWPRLAKLPPSLRGAMASGLTLFSEDSLNRIGARLPVIKHWSRPGEKIHRSADLLNCPDVRSLYAGLSQVWKAPNEVLMHAMNEGDDAQSYRPHWSLGNNEPPDGADAAQWMMFADQTGYLHNDILTKVDRAAMSVSLETRTPFLDHRVAEFAWSLPSDLRIRNNKAKWLLRSLLGRYLSQKQIERPKMGFSIPLHDLLRGPLKEWASSQLSPNRLSDENWFDPEVVQKLWHSHLSGESNEVHKLWPILMFQSWLENNETLGSS